MRDIVAALQETMQRNHLKILEAARSDWQSRRGSQDASDACATIRIESAAPRKKRETTPASNSRRRRN